MANCASQPLLALLSQSPKPWTHTLPQRPAVQAADTAPGRMGQMLPQWPQCSESPSMLISQPLPGLPSQSPKPSLQR